jgi:hypothetical protein
MSQYEFATEIVSLPSQGKCYPTTNPLSSGNIELKYMTAREEEILTSQSLIKKGVVLDKLFEAIIVDKGVNPDDIILGDKNAIMLATRILGYGPEYKIQIQTSTGETESINVDLGKVQTKDIDFSKLSSDNRYQFTTSTGNVIIFKLLTHGDEKRIDSDVTAMKRLNKDSLGGELTTRYRYMIVSVDGNEDTKSIIDFINNKFLSKDTKAFREYLKLIQPDIKMEFNYTDPETGETEVRSIPMGVNFFWPTD